MPEFTIVKEDRSKRKPRKTYTLIQKFQASFDNRNKN
jgi:hypothetical protein